MDIDMAHGNGTDRVCVSVNSPASDLVEYWEVQYVDLDRLDVLVSARVILDDGVDRAVAGARSAGASWEAIGAALGMSKQGAQQRYGSP